MRIGNTLSFMEEWQKYSVIVTVASLGLLCKKYVNFNSCQAALEALNNSKEKIASSSVEKIASSSLNEYSIKELNCTELYDSLTLFKCLSLTAIVALFYFTYARYIVKKDLAEQCEGSGLRARTMRASRQARTDVTRMIEERSLSRLSTEGLKNIDDFMYMIDLVGGDRQELNELAALRKRVENLLHASGFSR